MNFICKCYLQKLFSILPNGEVHNYYFQKYITKKIPVDDRIFLARFKLAQYHFEKFAQYANPKTNEWSYYEFGSGWDLMNPIGLSLLGMKKLYCIDIKDLIFPDILADTIKRLYLLKDKMPFNYILPQRRELHSKSNCREALKDVFNIHYKAPIDARETGLADSSIDFIGSNNTFEHIPISDILPILLECHRILKANGIFSIAIDYGDHWSHFDSNISRYNFLKFSPRQWEKYNPSLHFQNRLRHKDYLELMAKANFRIVEETAAIPVEREFDSLKKMKINDYFTDNYSYEELAVKGSKIVLQKEA